MQVQLRCMGGQMMLTFTANDVKDLIKQVSEIDEVFGECTCGACQSPNVKVRHRVADKYDFYEMSCMDCRASLQFGQAREGGRLFPRRKDKEGGWLDNYGWVKWKREGQDQPAQQPSQASGRGEDTLGF